VPEILGVMVESCAPSGCRACLVLSPCTCRSRTVGILEIAGIQAPMRGLLSGARTVCSIPSGKSQCVEGGVIFAAWCQGSAHLSCPSPHAALCCAFCLFFNFFCEFLDFFHFPEFLVLVVFCSVLTAGLAENRAIHTPNPSDQ